LTSETSKGNIMKARTSLTLLILGIAVTCAVFPVKGPAQAPHAAIARRLDEVRMAKLLQTIRQRALSVKAEDLAKLPSEAKLLSPFLTKVGPTPAKPSIKPHALPVEKGKSAAKDHRLVAPSTKEQKTAANKASSTEPPKGTQPDTKPTPFNPYPQGPEPRVPPTPAGYYPSVSVLAPGRLDWTYVVSQQSLDPEPTRQTAGYLSSRQTYELYVPSQYSPRRPNAMIIHVTAGTQSDAWLHWQYVCRTNGVILAGVHNAGNAVPMPLRARIVLDVLDDIRRRFNIDPDRTYISGSSGGGNAASRIAFALPELFGGLIAICGTWNLRPEPMLRQRVSERLSVAVVTGTGDFNGPELANEFFPVLRAHNARARLWVYPMGHAYPNPAQMDQIFRWAEAGLLLRRMDAKLFPASRLIGPASPDQWSTAMLFEAAERVDLPGGLASALFALQEIVDRWKGLPAAELAAALLKEFDAYSPVPWKEIYRNELLRFRYLQARMFDNTLNMRLPANYPVARSNLIGIAVWLWTDILELAPADSPIAQEAKARLDLYHKQGA
jgi:pimeloyl-ACP methyl ester carboxylesterase